MPDNSLRADLVEVQKKVAENSVLVTRFDAALDKLTEVSLNVSKLLAVHEQRIEAQEEINRNLPILLEKRRQEVSDALSHVHDRISAQELGIRNDMATAQKEILAEIKDVRSDINELGLELKDQTNELRNDLETSFEAQIESVSKRVSKLERYSWLAIGGGSVAGFIASQAYNFAEHIHLF